LLSSLAVGVSSSENRNSMSESVSPSLARLISIIGDLLPEKTFLRLLFEGASSFVLRNPLETLTAHTGTPIGFRSVDVAGCLGSCSTSTEGSGLLQIVNFVKPTEVKYGLESLLACRVCTAVFGGSNLDKKVSTLDPVDMLNHKVWITACELSWAIDDLVQAHS
jgi:hypothetical protein